jgi:hypothetical protein
VMIVRSSACASNNAIVGQAFQSLLTQMDDIGP